MTPRAEAALDHWTKARAEFERTQRLAATAAQLFVQNRITVDELRAYVEKMGAAERASDHACSIYRRSYGGAS